MDRNEYERLIKEGYTEEDIKLKLEEISKMSIFDSPLGENREDRGVVVKDSAGLEKRTSSIMMGYNKQGIVLENGEYVSWEEIENALGETLNSPEEEVTYVCKKTGKKVEPAEIIDEIRKRSMDSTYLIHEPTDVISNQTAARMIIHDESDMTYPKGVSMLGNNGIQMPSGEYVSKAEIELALADYIKMIGPSPVIPEKPEKDPIPPTIDSTIGTNKPTPPIIEPVPPKKEPEPVKKDEEIYKVIKRIVHKASPLIMAATMTASLIISGFGREDVTKTTENIREAQKVSFGASAVQEMKEVPPSLQRFEELTGQKIVVGEEISVPEGVSFYESSDHEYGGANKSGTFGQGLREAGDYSIEGISILNDQKITKVSWEDGKDLLTVLEELAKEKGVTIEELESKIHLGGPVSGWVSVNDIIDAANKDGELVEVKIKLDEEKKYDGVIDDFKGDFITINNGKEDVQIRIKNQDGTFIEEGTIITGSDGQDYQMTDLEIEDYEILTTTEDMVGTKVNWSLKNISLEEVLAGAALTALAGYVSKKIPRKEMTEMTGTQIDELIRKERKEFEDAKGEYEGRSEFAKATETLTTKKVVVPRTSEEILRTELIDQDITVEDIQSMNESGGQRKR